MRCLGLDSNYFRAKQLGPETGGRARRLAAEPTSLRVVHPTLPSLKPKDMIWKSRDNKRPQFFWKPKPSPVLHPLLKWSVTHALKQPSFPQFLDAWGKPRSGFPCWETFHFTCLSLWKKEILSLFKWDPTVEEEKILLNCVSSFGLRVRWIWVLILSKWEMCLVL